ncbi:MAG: DUF996 domain-containing protein [Nitrososphaerota archaeon]
MRAAGLSVARTLGLTGSILLPIGGSASLLLPALPLPGNPPAGIPVVAVGYGLLLMAVRRISDVTGDGRIFRDMLLSVAVQLDWWSALGLTFLVAQMTGLLTPEDVPRLDAVIEAAILVGFWIGLWAVTAASAWLLRRSFTAIALRTGAGRFASAGRWYWLGALLLVVVVGAALMLVGFVQQVLAFRELPDEPEPPALRPVATRPVA